MDMAIHFYSRAAKKYARNPFVFNTCARPILKSLRRHSTWGAPVDIYSDFLALIWSAYRTEKTSETSSISRFDLQLFQRRRQDWLSPLETHWFHLGKKVAFDIPTLVHLFVIRIRNVDCALAQSIAFDMQDLPHYHSCFEIDGENPSHRDLYHERLFPRVSLLSLNEAALLLEAGSEPELDVCLINLVRRIGFRRLHLEAYWPWDFSDRERLDTKV
jgi:hypothetical protein